jgi:hypothetical protein
MGLIFIDLVTLENLGLVLNPFDRTLRPMRAMLASATARTHRRAAAEALTLAGPASMICA